MSLSWSAMAEANTATRPTVPTRCDLRLPASRQEEGLRDQVMLFSIAAFHFMESGPWSSHYPGCEDEFKHTQFRILRDAG